MAVLVIFFTFLTFGFIFYGLECKRFGGNGESIKHKNEGISIAKTIYGDTYNCIAIYKQPAFSHPALYNHKIQMSLRKQFEEKDKPTFGNHTSRFNPNDIWLEGGCPEGTVPIRQMTKEQEDGAYANRGLNSHSLASTDRLDFAGIIAELRPGKKYHGAQANIDLYNPKVVEPRQYSSATIAIQRGLDEIQVGWIVYPQLYGDYRTRLYTSWKSANNHGPTGCYNHNCPGFVAVNRKIPLDFAFPQISKVEGEQYDIRLRLSLATGTGNWYLFLSDTNEIIGYWPNSIFISLGRGADTVLWGGQVFTPSSDAASPQMGSGQFKNGQRQKTCYMRKVSLVDERDETILPDNSFIKTRDSRCYYEGDNFLSNEAYWEYSFLFGGTGGKDKVTCVY